VKLIEARADTITAADIAAPAGDAPVVKLVNYVIYHAVKDAAAEIHVEPGDTSSASVIASTAASPSAFARRSR